MTSSPALDDVWCLHLEGGHVARFDMSDAELADRITYPAILEAHTVGLAPSCAVCRPFGQSETGTP